MGLGKKGVAGAIGVGVARNLIGYQSTSGSSGGGNIVQAYLREANVTATGSLDVTAKLTDRVSAESVAGSVALSAGLGALSLAGMEPATPGTHAEEDDEKSEEWPSCRQLLHSDRQRGSWGNADIC